MAQDFKLQQTKGRFKVAGIVYGLDRDNAYSEGTSEKTGKDWRSLQFKVKTSLTNEVYVEAKGFEQDFVWPYSKKYKEAKKIPWNNRFNLPDSYHLIGVSASLERDDKGNLVRENFTDFDGTEYLYNNMVNESSVYISGEIEHSQYDAQDGNKVKQTKYIVKNISLTKQPIDFESEKFTELASFEQSFVFVEKIIDRDEGKMHITGYIINYGDKWVPAQFVVNMTEENAKLVNNINRKLKFGDLVTAVGLIRNELEEVEIQEDDEWGGMSPDGFNKAGSRVIKEMLITNITGHEPKKYKEEDFVESVTYQQGGTDFLNEDYEEDDDSELPF
ncbi:MAG: hypothetical protein ACOYJ1_15855 [Peptococcales bacterium]